ncbi:NmrA/HSCARG family protein [Mucilaginibacter angelicae]|uniref:NmrA/HSCARG family protein n=1 Tax=Mucilaginibacter angelicae TaxID=869718 RepID=A0ABV6L032_9SPHI
MNFKRKIIICGATGNQGGAVAAAMLAEGIWNVVALTRDPQSVAAFRLAAVGASVLKADTRDLSSLVQAFAGAYGVFGLTQPWCALKGEYDIESEIIQGKNIIWACKQAKVSHLIFSSFISFADGRTGVSFIDSKLRLENILSNQDIPYTILQSAVYMEHIDWQNDSKDAGTVSGNYAAKSLIPYTALRDIGRCAAFIFAEPGKFIRRTIQVTGDVLSGEMIAEILTRLTSRAYRYRSRSKLWLWFFRPETFRLRLYLERSRGYQPAGSAALKMNSMEFPFKNTTVAEFFKRKLSGL